MKIITLEEYESQLNSIIGDVVSGKDIVKVDCGTAGAFLVMEEPACQIMRDALMAVFSADDPVPVIAKVRQLISEEIAERLREE